MNYDESLEYTHSLLKFGIKPGLERIEKLLSLLGNPQDYVNCIHVAGTNGKGSTCAMISSVLIEAGKKTGLFISPFVVDFRERIQINGQYISKEDYSKIATVVKNAVDSGNFSESPTEFEFITAVAFLYFKKNKCDVCVIETGMGGRLDSTNVIKKPLCSVITQISMDHTSVLGDSIQEIAFEKCGIIKKCCPVVTYSLQNQDALSVIMECASNNFSTVLVPSIENIRVIKTDLFGSTFEVGNDIFSIPLSGTYQIENARLAIEVACLLNIPKEIIRNGLEKAKHPARFQVICKNPLTILDGAHNVGGLKALKHSIETYFPDEKLLGVCGMLSDKDYYGSMKTILPLFDEIIAVTPDNPRALDKEKMCELVKNCGVKCSVTDVNENLKKIIKNKSDGRSVVFFGSLYLASDILHIYGK